MKFNRLLVLLLLPMAGCATTPSAPPTPLPQVPPGLTDVYVTYYTSGSCDLDTVALQLDGAPVGQLRADQYLQFSMPPGKHHLTAADTAAPDKVLSLPLDGSPGARLFQGIQEWGINCAPPEPDDETEASFFSNRNYLTQASSIPPALSAASGGYALPPAQRASAAPVALQPASSGLSMDEIAHFKSTLANGKPAQLYFLATEMTYNGHQDLALQLYQRLVDKFPDDIYTAKAIEKMDHGFQPATAERGPTGAGGMGLSPQQLAHVKEAHDACVALCQSQSKQCNGAALGSAASSTMGYMTSVMSGDAMGMLSHLGQAGASAMTDCDTPERACEAACPLDPTATAGNPAPAIHATNGTMK